MYVRQLPKDLYKEAVLLRCLGRLVELIEDQDLPGWSYTHHVDDSSQLPTRHHGFDIRQDDSDGRLYCSNLSFNHGPNALDFLMPYHNTDHGWPLEDWNGENVFSRSGTLIYPGKELYLNQ